MTFISVAGLVLGVAVLVIVLSVMNGFERELRLRVLGVLPQGIIFAEDEFADWRALLDEAQSDPQCAANPQTHPLRK